MIFRTLDLARAIFVSNAPFIKRQRRIGGSHHLLDALEARQLMSAAAAPAGFFNLTGTLVSTTIPANLLAGQALSGSVTVAVKNAGTLALPTGHSKEQVTIQLIAHEASDSTDTVLTTTKPINISQIQPGTSGTFPIALKNVSPLPAGDYTFAAVITPVPALTESSTDDNRITTTAANGTLPIHVSDADITGTLGGTTLPTAVIAGSKTVLPGKLDVLVTNNSTAALPAGEQVTMVIKAHNTATHADVIVGVDGLKRYSISALGAGSTVMLEANVRLSGKILPTGTYTLEALVTPVQNLVESNATNNLITLNAVGQPMTVTSGAAMADLTGTLGGSTIVSTATSTAGQLTINVANTGDAPITTAQPVSFSIVARPAGELDNFSDVPLTTATQNFSIQDLKPGKSTSFNIAVNSNTALSGGVYDLLATIIAAGIAEPTTNNVSSQTATGATVSVTSKNAVVPNLNGTIVTVRTFDLDGSSVSTTGILTSGGLVHTAGLDISNSQLIVETNQNAAVTIADLQEQIASGAGAFQGILSSSNIPTGMTLAVVDNSVEGDSAFGGAVFISSGSAIRSELLGDVEGQVGLTDLSTVLNNFGSATSGWTSGNFDGAGTIDLTDLSNALNNLDVDNPAPVGTTSGSDSTTITTAGTLTFSGAATLTTSISADSGTLNIVGSSSIETIPVTTPVTQPGSTLTGETLILAGNPVIIPGNGITQIGGHDVSISGTLNLAVTSVDVTNVDGTITIGNLSINGSASTFDLPSLLSLVPHIIISGGGHQISLQANSGANTGTLILDGTTYQYTSASGSSGTLTLTVSAPATSDPTNVSTTST